MRRRIAFTLVELLVVVAIISVLAAILLPAVQSAREAARRITCANHLKQLALAILQHSSAHAEELPSAYRTYKDRTGGEYACTYPVEQPISLQLNSTLSFGWRTWLLPYIEEQAVHDRIDFSQPAYADANRKAIAVTIPLFQCPSTDGFPRVLTPSGIETGAYDYHVSWVGVYDGSPNFRPAAFYGLKDIRMDGDEYPNFEKARQRLWDRGQCMEKIAAGPAKLKWVTDGLSKTTMIGEQAHWPTWIWRKHTIKVDRGAYFSWASAVGMGNVGLSHVPINQNNETGRFSSHPQGVNNALLDGSVGFLSVSTDVEVLRALDSRSGDQ